jgi:penicillin-binding protein 1C
MKLRWNLIYKLAISIILTPIIALVLLPLPKNIQKEYSVVIKFKNGDVMRIYKTTDDSFRIYTSIDEIDPKLINAALCYEDKYFYYHLGINPFSIIRALYQNLKARKTISGGSTITMQLVKIINPRPRTISSKLLEAITALHYELHLSKKQILQFYFNYAPYGGNLYGVAAAAYSYFGKSPKNLYYDEIAYLLALPQSPSKRKAGSKYAAETIRKRNKILYKLLQCELISEKEYSQAINAPLPKTTSPMPFDAPHAADFIKAYYASNNKNTQVYHSTIDENIQKTTASIVSNYKYLLN